MTKLTKQASAIITLLNANLEEKVKAILPQVNNLVTSAEFTSATRNPMSILDANNKPLAVCDWISKNWYTVFDPADKYYLEYGSKVSNKTTGLNTMSVISNRYYTQMNNALGKMREDCAAKLRGQQFAEAKKVQEQMDDIGNFRDVTVKVINETLKLTGENALKEGLKSYEEMHNYLSGLNLLGTKEVSAVTSAPATSKEAKKK